MIYLRDGTKRNKLDPLAICCTSWQVKFDKTYRPLYKEDWQFKVMSFYTPIAPNCLEKW